MLRKIVLASCLAFMCATSAMAGDAGGGTGKSSASTSSLLCKWFGVCSIPRPKGDAGGGTGR